MTSHVALGEPAKAQQRNRQGVPLYTPQGNKILLGSLHLQRDGKSGLFCWGGGENILLSGTGLANAAALGSGAAAL